MSCCICMGSDNVIKVKCCNQPFHVDCLNQWLQQKKYTCPMCRNVKDFMGSLPCMRQAVTEALDHIFQYPYGYYIQKSDIICGAIIVKTHSKLQRPLLRSDSNEGFFFDYKGNKLWIKVRYSPRFDQDLRYMLTFID